MGRDMGTVKCIGLMDRAMKASGNLMYAMARVPSIIQMEINMTDCGKTIKLTDMELISMRTELLMLENGTKISNMDTE